MKTESKVIDLMEELKKSLLGETAPQWTTKDRAWWEYPIGTEAHAINGGHWTRVADGWKAQSGDVFPRPGGDVDVHRIRVPVSPWCRCCHPAHTGACSGVQGVDRHPCVCEVRAPAAAPPVCGVAMPRTNPPGIFTCALPAGHADEWHGTGKGLCGDPNAHASWREDAPAPTPTDTQRLDWWFAHGLTDSVCEGSVDLWWADDQHEVERVTHGVSVRDALDKAMRGIYEPDDAEVRS